MNTVVNDVNGLTEKTAPIGAAAWRACAFAAALVMLSVGGIAQAASLKIATLAPDGTSWMKEMRAAGKRIEAQTEGRVKLKFYPGGVMGNHQTVLRKMRIGQLHGGAFSAGEVVQIYPDMHLYSLPFLFRSEDEVRYVRETLDPLLIKGLEERGLVSAGIIGGGFAYIMSEKRIANASDLKGRSVWVPEGDVVSYTGFEVAGVTPKALPLSDVYTGLQTGLLDTVVNTPVGAIAFQWHTKIRHMADLRLGYVSGVLAFDKKALKRVSEADQAIMQETLSEVAASLDALNRVDNEQALAALANQGIKIHAVPKDDLGRWELVGEETLERLLNEENLQLEYLDLLQSTLKSYRAGRDQVVSEAH